MTVANDHDGPCIYLERSLPSRVTAISPLVDNLMLLIRKSRCAPECETDVEIALREALANGIIHGNREDPRKRVYVSCRFKPNEVSIPDPTTPENIGSVHGRGICLMKALMDEVRFEEGGAVVRLRKSAI